MADRPNPARRVGASLLAATAFSLFALLAAPARADDVALAESGSTLLYPLFNVWAAEYAKTHSGVKITTAGTGSGAGIEQAVAGAVQIGASDAYMSDSEARKHPEIVNVPMAISAQTVNYNLPGLNTPNLRLDGPTLAAIYTGKIRHWDDGAISALNPGVTLPHKDIIAVHRVEDTFDNLVHKEVWVLFEFFGFLKDALVQIIAQGH